MAIGAALLVLGGGVTGWIWVSSEMHRVHASWDGPFVDVDLAAGLSASAMLTRLGELGVVRRPGLVRRWLSLRGGAEELQAGEYRFERPASALEVLARLRQGDVLLHSVTVPEGLMLEQVAERIAEVGLAGGRELIEAFRNPAPIRDLDPQAEDLEGYLYPETYRFPKGTSAARIASAMVERFRDFAGEDYVAAAATRGLDLRQAVTLASMIERETSVAGERGRISRVFHNRLQRGMRMQCDPTVLYALHRAGRSVERLTYRDLEFESPWNTYVVSGLPPGPIANPGRLSLEAAVAPDPGNDIYFVAAPGGGHRFSPTLEAHLKAVAAWRRYSSSSR